MNSNTDNAVGAQHAAPLQARLQDYYRRQIDPAAQISSFTPISDGWETEVYAFDLTLQQQIEPMILRMYPGVDAVEKSTREFTGIGLLHQSGYPVPRVYRHETDQAWLGKPFIIMQRIDGRALERAAQEQPARRNDYFRRLVQLMVDLHHLPVAPFRHLDAGDPADFLARKLAQARTVIVEQAGQTWMIPLLEWVEARLPDLLPSPLAVLHNDFHPFNVLLTPTDAAYVIDWGNIEVGDTRYDLAWTLLLHGTWGVPEQRDHFLREYERLAGRTVPHIEVFEVIAAVRRLFGFAITLTSGGESAGMRPEAAAIMRGQHSHFQQVYAVVPRVTGIRIAEIEALLASIAPA